MLLWCYNTANITIAFCLVIYTAILITGKMCEIQKGRVRFMTFYMQIGIITGVVVGLLLVVLLLKITKKDGKIKCKYDERQANIRGKGFQASFFTLIIYNAIYGLLGIMVEKPFMDTLTAVMIGICLSVAVYAVYCIWNDAYFSLNESPKRLLIAFGIIAALNLVIGCINLFNGNATTDGILNFRCINLFCGILFIVIFVALLAKAVRNAGRRIYEES